MPPSPYQQGSDQAYSSNATDYALYQAGTDPLVSALATMLDKKLGGGQGIFTDLINLLGSNMGVENGSVTAAASIQANLQRVGAPAIGAGSGIGMIGGRDFISAQAASALQEQMKNSMFRSNGTPLPFAQNLTTSEIGRLSGHLISSGGLYGSGPAFSAEMLTKESIQKRVDTARQGGDKSQLEDAMKLKAGEFDVRLTPTMKDAWDKKLKEGAETLRYIKDILGSEALKDIAGSSQFLLGGDFASMKPGEARSRIAQIETVARLYHGGDVKSAAASHVAAIRDTAGFIGGPGMNPEEAAYRFGGIAGATASTVTGLANAAGASNAADQGMGINGRPKGTAEVQQENAADVAAYLTEEKEALALMTVSQNYGNSLSQEQRTRIEQAMTDLGSAGSSKGIASARGNIEALISEITGGDSTGSILGDPAVGGVEGALSKLGGSHADRLGRMSTDILRNRNQTNLRSQFGADHRSQFKFGMSSGDFSELGMGAANLSSAQFSDLQKIMGLDYSDQQEQLERFFGDTGVQDALGSAGVDFNKFQELISGRSAGELTDIRGMRTRYNGTGNFVGTGDTRLQTEKMLGDFFTRNQAGVSSNTGDPMIELIKGLTGEGGISTTQIMERARRGVDGQASDLVDFTAVNGKMDASDRNIGLLKKKFGDDAYKMFGVEAGNDAGLKDAMGDSAKQEAAYRQMQQKGFVTFEKDRASFLSNEDGEKWKNSLTDDTRSAMLRRMSGDGTRNFSANAGESKEDSEKRFKKMLAGSFNRGFETPGADGQDPNNWNQIDDLVSKSKIDGDGKSSSQMDMMNYLLDNNVLKNHHKNRLKPVVEEQFAAAHKKMEEAGWDEKKAGKETTDRYSALYVLKEKLGGMPQQNQSVTTMNVTTMHVQNPNGERSHK